MGDFYLDAIRKVDALVAAHGFDVKAVPHAVGVVYLITQLEFEIATGGVAQWLVNRSGRYAEDTVTALREIGAAKCAAIVQTMVDLLGSGANLSDDGARTAAIQRASAEVHAKWRGLADDLLDWPEDVDRLLRDYVAAHTVAFS